MDPEQEISIKTLDDIRGGLQLREDVPPRLISRAMTWAIEEIQRQRAVIQNVAMAIEGETP